MAELPPHLLARVQAMRGSNVRPRGVPLRVLYDEAIALASFVRRNTAATDVHAGLEILAPMLDVRTPDDLLALVEAAHVAEANARYAQPGVDHQDDLPRARVVLRELKAALRFALDLGPAQRGHAQLAAITRGSRARPRSIHALAGALHQHAALAEMHRETLASLGAFEPLLIDEAMVLCQTLLHRPKPQERHVAARSHRTHRNRVLAVLDRLIKQTRATIRFALREHPQLVREASSGHARRARASQRRAARAQTQHG